MICALHSWGLIEIPFVLNAFVHTGVVEAERFFN